LDNLENPSEFKYRFLDRVQVKGKKKYVDIFEIFDCDSESQKDMKLKTKKDFEQGISSYQDKDFKEALSLFNRVLGINNNDIAARLYAKRCRDFELYGLPDGWEGITTLNHK
jgi:two-component system sensor histidine kinase ChiS